MSNWINKDLFNQFQEEKKKETESTFGVLNRSDTIWRTPEKGTADKPKVYEGRFLPDKNGVFYKKYYYHMFQSGETWVFTLCPKTFDFNAFCPLCKATSELYQGTSADKKMAQNYKRKEKFVGNFFIISDPRDNEQDEEDKKVNGKVRLYEFPSKVEIKLKEEITDTKNGLGADIFNPGPEGYDFILKVFATKKDQYNKIWPDYSSSTFSRRASALGTNAEIEKIMKSTIDIDNYLKGLIKDDEKIIALLKAEMLWDLVKDDYARFEKMKEVSNNSNITPSRVTENTNESMDDTFEDESVDEASDEDLLAELENL